MPVARHTRSIRASDALGEGAAGMYDGTADQNDMVENPASRQAAASTPTMPVGPS